MWHQRGPWAHSLSLNATSAICSPGKQSDEACVTDWLDLLFFSPPIHWRLPSRIVTFFRNKKRDPWAHKTLFSFHSFHYNTNVVFGLLYLPRISSRCFWKQVFCLFVCFCFFSPDFNTELLESTITKDSHKLNQEKSFSGLWRSLLRRPGLQ